MMGLPTFRVDENDAFLVVIGSPQSVMAELMVDLRKVVLAGR
jgi:hypothetical protein